ncbi:hypothetical protein Daus18300_001002 [Diaporthe australafricana]|uniref:aminodeoxychorismate synthase n=1 Tax=Diaporthe australafricana TaxID=127596 RepID=A0ABR3Y0Z4_9PEZI
MGSLGESPRTPSSNRPRVLFIDAYDSFSNNITSLLATLLDVDVFVLPIDTAISKHEFRRELSHYEAVVCGPGPGSPENEADVGLMSWLWELPDDELVPVLGVCLGFQSLVLSCGGKVRRLRRGLHGMVRKVEHRTTGEDNIFEGVRDFNATLYHSLCADVGQDTMKDWRDGMWDHPAGLCDIVPLAWVEEDRDDGQDEERVLMAMKHQRKPFWGLQYHPESVCTEEAGNQVIRNWFKQALRWNYENRVATSSDGSDIRASRAFKRSLLQQVASVDGDRELGRNAWESLLRDGDQKLLYKSRSIETRPARGVEVPDIVEILGCTDTNHVILDSANGNQPRAKTGVDVRGRSSIIALNVDESVRIESHTGDNFISIQFPGQPLHNVSFQPGENVWHLLAEFHAYKRSSLETHGGIVPHESDVPFLGGFVGYVTYEQGLSDIGIAQSQEREHRRPDVCLAWATKSIVVHHEEGVLHIQDLEGDTQWIASVAAKLEGSDIWRHGRRTKSKESVQSSPALETQIRKPEQAKYEAKVRMCQEYIAAGDSYELCLTDQTHITRTVAPEKKGWHMKQSAVPSQCPDSIARKTIQHSDTSWDLYRTLRKRNPAPFASYIRLGGATLISSSPERFLQYDRSGLCSMKPMKGTVKKSSEPADGCATSLEEAEAILHIPKEEAENLMIVDLVRHDMHGVCGAGQVWVPELLKVEEYQTVYQMITVVEGQLPQPDRWNPHGCYSGLDVLSASLPPGSMTGAPKKRSCEILQQIEGDKERSLYSGVVGYMCISGRGDWSVTIRSMFRWDDERQEGEDGEERETWHIGAGGAVTILSTPEGEREEMFVKLARPLSIFGEMA